MAKVARKYAQREAARVLRLYGSHSLPIDVEGIARRMRVSVIKQTLGGGISGLLYADTKGTLLFVEQAHSRTRQRFSIAHELGHFFLHNRGEHVLRSPVLMARSGASSTGEVKEEIEANQFAAELLMPKELLDQIVSQYDRLDDDDLLILADRFDVSPQAMAIRLSRLGHL